ncbi:MAG: tyrosine-type recombinase/integrase [SAR324 cluster bacterium]|nr:tyrosine-type recombinase/integrase [SAR324 cluster bacterium]
MKKRGLTENEIKKLEIYIRGTGSLRDLVIFRLSLDTMLRVGDVLTLKVKDVFFSDEVKETFKVKMMKTENSVTCSLSEKTREILKKHILENHLSNDDFLFQGRKKTGKSISKVQWHRILKSFVDAVGIDENEIATHSLRKSLPTIIYKKTGNLKVCQNLLGHKSISNTSLYIGVDEKESLDIKKSLNII